MRSENIRAQEAGHSPHLEARLNIRILVVEDDVDLRRITSGILVEAGYEVESAEDGEIAWQMIQRNDYALVITDNNMPRLTGIELLRLLHSERIAIPVILLTGQLPTDEMRRSPDLKIEAVIIKPYTEMGLLTVVTNVLKGFIMSEPAGNLIQKPLNPHAK